MADYFFDSSALVKRYHAEAGTLVVDEIANTASAKIRISRLTPAELISAFAIKVRTRFISREDADLLLQQFHDDLATGKLEVYSIAESEFAAAEKLVESTPSTAAFELSTLCSWQSRWNFGVKV